MKLEIDEEYLVLIGIINGTTPIPQGILVEDLITSYLKTSDFQMTLNQFDDIELILFQNPYERYPTGIIKSTGLTIYGNAVILCHNEKNFLPVSFKLAEQISSEITYLGHHKT